MKVSQALSVRGGVMALLALYLAAFISSPAGVPHLHHDTHLVHDDACRKDPCHVAIYHPGDEHHCKHKQHLTAASKECDLCKISMVPQVLAEATPNVPSCAALQKPSAHPCTQLVLREVNHLANKGPPSTSF